MTMPRSSRLLAVLAAGAALLLPAATLAASKVRVGLMLPYTGTYAGLGNNITNGFKLFVEENGGKLGGSEVEYFTVDDESDPAKAPDNASKLIKRDKVDVLVGTVHSGVAMAMAKVARDNNSLLINPNAGAAELTGALCSPNHFRTSFTMWQSSHTMGKVAAAQGKKTAVTFTWGYAAGNEAVEAFKEGFEAAGGKVVKAMTLPFPQVEFQSYLTEIAALKPDMVFSFFSGGGARKYLADYAAAGLKAKIPLYGPGFLTEGVLDGSEAAQGVQTTLHYADGLDNAKDKAFRAAYLKAFKAEPDVFSVQGYDAAQLLAAGLAAVKGDTSKRKEMIAAMEGARLESPRGKMSLSKAHNPVNDIYLRKVEGKLNKMVNVAAPALADPARGCKM
ncbi:MAG: ABC transporter substrate-binding protein [Deltaproteobacteria bacterium]|nr:ABC transporter substrate-binding protein [Deltaproteobacteria bacterium]